MTQKAFDPQIPKEKWHCLECKGTDVRVIVNPSDPHPVLLKEDILVCVNCGFRFYAKTLSDWCHGKQQQKRGTRKSQVPPAVTLMLVAC